MRKVLISGPRYYNFLHSVEDAFVRLGFNVVVEGYDVPVNPYNLRAKLKWKFTSDRMAVLDENCRSWCSYIRRRFDEIRPDAVFILNGDIFDTATLDYFRRGAKVALWFFDARERLPRAQWHCDHVDAFFCFDQRDVEWYAGRGRKAYFLPQACDTSIYRPLGTGKDIDVLFVGNIYHSRLRKDTLLKVVQRFSDRKIEVYGLFQPWYKGLWGWMTRPYKRIFKNVNVDPETVNRLYNRSRVVLNVHEEHQKDGANPKVFEISGSGAYQICDRNPYIAELFPSGEVGLYSGIDEMLDMIESALGRDNGDAASAAYGKVMARHTYDERIKEVLDKLALKI